MESKSRLNNKILPAFSVQADRDDGQDIVEFILNGEPVVVQSQPTRTLLEVLRDQLGLTGTKQGCDMEGECGACTVLLDGQPIRSCLCPVKKVEGRSVVTIEGLATANPAGVVDSQLHEIQSAFIETGAVQCGFCAPGMILTAKALLDETPDPDREQVVSALEGNLCRCAGYGQIIEAVNLASGRLREGGVPGVPAAADTVGLDDRRADAREKVTGQLQYVEDIPVPGILSIATYRSPFHHARLVALDTSEAEQLPGVVRVLSAEEIPGTNNFSEYSPDEHLLVPVGERVRSKGDPIALVIGNTPEDARQGAASIHAEFEELPSNLEMTSALRPGAFPIHGTNNVLSVASVSQGDVATELANSDRRISVRYQTAYVEHAAMERESALGSIDEAGRITVEAGNHEPHWQQRFIARILDLETDRVRVVTPPTGGSFGGRQDPWPLAATALAVYWLRRPVRLVYSRQESFQASPKRHPYELDMEIGATAAGGLTGLRVRILANTGAYDSDGRYVAGHAVATVGGPYRWGSADVLAKTVYTNGTKSGQMRGFGAPQAAFGLECALDELAQKLGVDPLAFRQLNVLEPASVSYLGYRPADSLGYVEVLEAIKPAYRRMLDEVQAFNLAHSDGRMVKGAGLAGMWYRFGKYGALRVEAHAELAADGHFVIYCSAPDYGQGITTVMSQLAAETLGVSRDVIEVVNADTARTPDSDMPGASRMTYWLGRAVCIAAGELRSRIERAAADLLDCDPQSIEMDDAGLRRRDGGSTSVGRETVARLWKAGGQSCRVIGLSDLDELFPDRNGSEPSPHFVTGAHLAQVTLDRLTGRVTVDRMVAAHDVGRVINRRDARGQIEGAVMMGLGAALMEEYDPETTSGFQDYYLPTIKSAPEIETILVEVPSCHGPLGAKALGEAPVLPATPAIINAISRAAGVRIREIPATSERILRAMRAGSVGGDAHAGQPARRGDF